MTVPVDDERRTALVARIQGFYLEEFEEDLSAFRAEQLLDFLLENAGPQLYNQAVQDARQWMQRKLDDLEGDVHVPEQPL